MHIHLPVAGLANARQTPGFHYDIITEVPISSCGLSSKFRATSWTVPRIKEGTSSRTSEILPWQVSIRTKDKIICRGAILSSWWILSTAHCFMEDLSLDHPIEIILHGKPSEKKKLDMVIIHEDFNSTSLRNNIALILLDSPISFSEKTTPICLPLLQDLSVWQDCWVATWKTVMADDVEKLTHILMKVALIDRDVCSKEIQGLIGNVFGAVSKENVEENCEMESGSPRFCDSGSNMKWFVVGIASWGGNCDPEGSLTIYTAVFSYLDWIQKATAQEGEPFIPEGADDIGPYTQVFIPDSFSGSSLLSMTCAIAPVLFTPNSFLL
ncbi:LOW QUALITY PROTEIN: serine protease 55 [Pseudonaja textilis]|uniref:LOW QUALITY PROTEIN: serine protease 55 n=1 Tax=Pseudonaja textilis TaxID=8673 RepID=UPI000EAA2165|nr:LOW QUALITY PROTEIN: serine protease 55 [Pseudonaja textilis]